MRWRRVIDGELQEEFVAHARSGEAFQASIGDGWRELVFACHRAVVAGFPEYELLAIKEKYGVLAFQAFPRPWRRPVADETFGAWTRDEHRRIDSIIEGFTQRSASICERCGQPGTLRGERKHWLTLCDFCDAEVED